MFHVKLYKKRRARMVRLKLTGATEGRLVGVSEGNFTVLKRTATHIAIKRKGFSYQPGSRTSGLRFWFPAETVIYAIVSETEDALGCERLLSWEDQR
jgi:hypothetical protein